MPIKASFTNEGPLDIDGLLKSIQEKTLSITERAVLEALEAACIDIVSAAKAQPSPGPYPPNMKGKIPSHQPNYIDWTQNLRGSIGYILYYNGQEHRKLFSGTAEGMKKGEDAARNAVSETSGAVAVIVAGEEYALAVESYGYNVISEQCQQLKSTFEEYLSLAKDALKGK